MFSAVNAIDQRRNVGERGIEKENAANYFNEFYPARNEIENSFENIFFLLNNTKHNYIDTANIILREENIIKQAIHFFRNSTTCVRFDQKKNQIDDRYISDLKMAAKEIVFSEQFLKICSATKSFISLFVYVPSMF